MRKLIVFWAVVASPPLPMCVTQCSPHLVMSLPMIFLNIKLTHSLQAPHCCGGSRRLCTLCVFPPRLWRLLSEMLIWVNDQEMWIRAKVIFLVWKWNKSLVFLLQNEEARSFAFPLNQQWNWGSYNSSFITSSRKHRKWLIEGSLKIRCLFVLSRGQ